MREEPKKGMHAGRFSSKELLQDAKSISAICLMNKSKDYAKMQE